MKDFWKRPELWLCICLAAVTLALYAQVHDHDFVDFDDGDYVFGNQHVNTGLNWQNISWAFRSGHSGNWHPVTWLSHMLDCQLFGLNPGPQHLVNVFLHSADVLLLFLLLKSLTGALWRSAFAAALFALHPLHVESVAWIAERKDVLSTLLGLCALQMYVWYVRKPLRRWYLLTVSFFVLGLMAKPMLVTLPFVFLLIDYWPLRRFGQVPVVAARQSGRATQSLGRRFGRLVMPLVREKTPFFLLAAISSVVTFLVQKAAGAVQTADLLPFAARVANATQSYVAYLSKTCWPTNLSVFYRLQPDSHPAYWSVLAAFFLLGVTLLAIRVRDRYPYLLVGWLWYMGTLVPVIGLVQVGSQAMADRYTYVPAIGVFIIVAWGLSDIATAWTKTRKPIVIASSLLLVFCFAAALHQIQYWRDTISIASHAVAVDGDNYMARQILGVGLAKRNKYAEAVAELSTAHQLRPSDVPIMDNLGILLLQVGKVDQALDLFAKAFVLKPDDPVVLRNMGRARLIQGKYIEAVGFFDKALRVSPDNHLVYRFLGEALAGLGRNQEAVAAYNSALRIRPRSAEALSGLATVLAGQGKIPDAIGAAERALQIDPNSTQAHSLLATILFRQGQMEKALPHYSEVLRANPGLSQAHYDLGVALHSLGRRAEAMDQYRETIRLQPDYVEAYYNLATLLDSQGDPLGAIANYREAIRLKPDYVEAHNNLGVAYFHSGQTARALESFSHALRLAPDNAAARRNRDAIMKVAPKTKRIP